MNSYNIDAVKDEEMQWYKYQHFLKVLKKNYFHIFFMLKQNIVQSNLE